MATAEVRARVRIVVNGQPVETPAATLAELLVAQGYGGQKVATARNGEFVSAAARGTERIAAGDRIEIVAARAGG